MEQSEVSHNNDQKTNAENAASPWCNSAGRVVRTIRPILRSATTKRTPLVAAKLWQRIAAVVGMLTSTKIAHQPDAEIPGKSIEQEIAGKRKTCPELYRKQRRTAGRIDCGDYVGAGCGENRNGSFRQRAISQIVFGREEQSASNDTQNDGPKSPRS